MANQYNKVLKLANNYLQVTTILPVLIERKLKQGPVNMEQVYEAFGPDNFKTVSEDEATIFTLSQAKLIQESYKLSMHRKGILYYIKPEIIKVSDAKQSLKRQLNNIKEITHHRIISTSSTSDFDTLDRFNGLKNQTLNPQVTTVDVDLNKYKINSITIQTADRGVFLANVIDDTDASVKVLSKDRLVFFTVETTDKKTGKRVKFGSLN